MKSVFDFIKARYQRFFKIVFFVCLFLCLIVYSGFPLNNTPSFRRVSNIFFALCTVLLFLYFILSISFQKEETLKSIAKRFIKNKATIFFLGAAFVSIFSFLIHQEFSKEGISTLLVNLCLISFSYAFTNIISFHTFARYFRKIAPFICLASLIIYLPAVFLDRPPYFLAFETSNEYVYNNFFFLTFQIIRSSNRNCGIFWEPGLHAIFLNIAILLEFYDETDKPKLLRLMIYVLSLLTTFSTSGFIIFLLILLPCLGRCEDKALRKKIIIALAISTALIIATFCFVPFMREKITSAGASMFSRLYGPIVNAQVFADGKIFGTGCLGESQYFYEKLNQLQLNSRIDSQVSTIGYFITAYGVFGCLLIIGCFVFFYLKHNFTIYEKLFFTLIFIAMLSVEPLNLNLLVFVFIFYLIGDRQSLIDSSSDNTLLSMIKNKLLNSDSKNKTLAKNSAGAIIVRGFAMLLGLFTASGYLTYFEDKKVLGIWFTVLQIVVFILTFDLGIGNGLKNRLIAALETNDKKQISKLITSSLLPMFLLSLFGVALGVLVCNLVDFHVAFNVERSAISQDALKYSMMIIVISIALQFFLKVVGNIYEALQKQFIANIFPLLTNLLLFIFVNFIKIDSSDSKLIALSIVYLVVSNLPYLIGGIIAYKTAFKGCKIKASYFDKSLMKDVISLGSKFLIIQLSLLLINSCNSIVLSRLYTSESVPDYSIYQKLFNVVIVICTLFAGPIWAIIAKAKSQQDGLWIQKLASLIKKVAIILIAADLALILLLQPILNIFFANYQITVNWICALIFGFHSIFMVIIGMESSICNGLEVLKPQIIGSLVGVVIKIALTIINFAVPELANNASYWYLTQLFSTLALIPSVIIMTIYSRKIIKDLRVYEDCGDQQS